MTDASDSNPADAPQRRINAPAALAIMLGSIQFPSLRESFRTKAHQRGFHEAEQKVLAYFRGATLISVGGEPEPVYTLNLIDDPRDTPQQALSHLESVIRKKQRELAKRGFEIEDILIYYIGHGQVEGSDFLLPLWCSDSEDLSGTCLVLKLLARKLAATFKTAKRIVYFLDCCYAADGVVHRAIKPLSGAAWASAAFGASAEEAYVSCSQCSPGKVLCRTAGVDCAADGTEFTVSLVRTLSEIPDGRTATPNFIRDELERNRRSRQQFHFVTWDSGTLTIGTAPLFTGRSAPAMLQENVVSVIALTEAQQIARTMETWPTLLAPHKATDQLASEVLGQVERYQKQMLLLTVNAIFRAYLKCPAPSVAAHLNANLMVFDEMSSYWKGGRPIPYFHDVQVAPDLFKGVLRVVAWAESSPDVPEPFVMPVHERQPLFGAPRAFMRSRVQYVPDTSREALEPHLKDANVEVRALAIDYFERIDSFQSFASLPLVAANLPVGVLNIQCTEARAFGARIWRDDEFNSFMQPWQDLLAQTLKAHREVRAYIDESRSKDTIGDPQS